MTNVVLFVATVLIWGTTWIAIAMQVGPVPPMVSVLHRFALAAAIFFIALALMGRLRLPKRRDAPFIAAQALCLYCCNFVCFYAAAAYVPSGLEAVIFSLASVFNAINARLFFGDAITPRAMIAGALGVAGVALLFGRELFVAFDADVAKGVALCVLATTFFSLGNMASRRNSAAGVPTEIANVWGMAGSSVFLLALALVRGEPLMPQLDARYLGALFYLAVFGSVIGFTTYLALVARIGSARAAYMTVLFPLVALLVSTLFEGYRWTPTALAGLALTLLGNAVMFWTPKRRATA